MFLESSFSIPHVLMSDTFPTFLNGYGLVDVVCVLDVVRSCIRKLNPIWSWCILKVLFLFFFFQPTITWKAEIGLRYLPWPKLGQARSCELSPGVPCEG